MDKLVIPGWIFEAFHLSLTERIILAVVQQDSESFGGYSSVGDQHLADLLNYQVDSVKRSVAKLIKKDYLWCCVGDKISRQLQVIKENVVRATADPDRYEEEVAKHPGYVRFAGRTNRRPKPKKGNCLKNLNKSLLKLN